MPTDAVTISIHRSWFICSQSERHAAKSNKTWTTLEYTPRYAWQLGRHSRLSNSWPEELTVCCHASFHLSDKSDILRCIDSFAGSRTRYSRGITIRLPSMIIILTEERIFNLILFSESLLGSSDQKRKRKLNHTLECSG